MFKSVFLTLAVFFTGPYLFAEEWELKPVNKPVVNPSIEFLRDGVRVSWDPVQNIGGYKLYFANSPYCLSSAELIATLNHNYWIGEMSQPVKSGFYVIVPEDNRREEWEITYGGPLDDCCKSVVETPDLGIAMTGYTTNFSPLVSDAFTAKMDASVSNLWHRTYVQNDTLNAGYCLHGGHPVVNFLYG